MTLHSRRDARTDLVHGTLDMLILRTLQWGPQHGYGIGQMIRSQSSDVLQVEAGSLYPALQRLAKRGWVTARWGQTDANQRAKFYRLTPEGRKQLLREESRWAELVNAIGRVMNPALAPEPEE
jgi:PadR family transcriptional regulator, regulatory protein PadR